MINEKPGWQTIFVLRVHEVDFHSLITETQKVFSPLIEVLWIEEYHASHFHGSIPSGINVLNFSKRKKIE